MPRFDPRDKVAAVTGAAAGIGRALAIQLARGGCSVALCDVDAEGLRSVRRECEALGVAAPSTTLDVGDGEAVSSWANEVASSLGAVHFVFNNAGTTLVSRARNLSVEEFEWLMGVNFWGVVHGTLAFLPHLEASGGGHIVNVSSAFGLIGNPGQSAYSASKFAVRGFTEALSMELVEEGSPVRAHVVHPGAVSTSFAREASFGTKEKPERSREEMVASFEKMARTSADEAARVILTGVARNNPRIMVGLDARGISLLQRLFPKTYQRIARPGIARRGLQQV
jgi:butyryl-CoA dehydrogenase